MRRTTFLGAAVASALAAGSSASAVSAQPAPFDARNGRRALVLAGGGARGAYEAGIVGAMVATLGLSDGMPLPYDLICGTSIGALNAFCVATAQYALLKWAWTAIPQYRVIRLMSPYDNIKKQSAGILTRGGAALSLGTGIFKDVRGVLNNAETASFIEEFISPSVPVHLPFYFASTNLSRMRGEIFVRRANTPAGLIKQATDDRLLKDYTRVIVREATNELLHSAIFASAAMPLAFEPIVLPSPEGTLDSYVDGGVTHNVPIGVARHCAATLDVVLVDPIPHGNPIAYQDAVEIGVGVFSTMQHSLLEYQLLLAYATSYIFGDLAGGATLPTPDQTGLKAILARTPLQFNVIRPPGALPGSVLSFSDAPALQAMWQRGYEDGTKGFAPYVPPFVAS